VRHARFSYHRPPLRRLRRTRWRNSLLQ